MAEDLKIAKKGTRAEKYELLTSQIEALISDESNLMANAANIAAALRQTFGFFWVGFYFVDSESELVLGPFQGDIACTRIQKGKGVCGHTWETEKTVIVDNVDEFPGHIACSSLSKSEIVVPVVKEDKVLAVLDVDSDEFADFSEVDQIHLEKIVEIFAKTIN
ncbi:MAG: GAF domain-containing protein [Crocinitomicaceae bacterium]|nr:GAF domain-containing protein [Crocinitomicaceae bacterium]